MDTLHTVRCYMTQNVVMVHKDLNIYEAIDKLLHHYQYKNELKLRDDSKLLHMILRLDKHPNDLQKKLVYGLLFRNNPYSIPCWILIHLLHPTELLYPIQLE